MRRGRDHVAMRCELRSIVKVDVRELVTVIGPKTVPRTEPLCLGDTPRR